MRQLDKRSIAPQLDVLCLLCSVEEAKIMFSDDLLKYEKMTDDELSTAILSGAVVDVMAVAVLLKRIHKKVSFGKL